MENSGEVYFDKIDKNSQLSILNSKLKDADAILIGAGAGLSTAAGFTYSGERFEKYFSDFAAKYGFRDMYSGGFYPFETLEEFWAYWSRYIFVNRYMDAPTNLYGELFELVKDKNYFVLTTNVDHQFQKAGFDKSRLFYTQGDFGLFQCSEPCHNKTYDNEEIVKKMIESQELKIENGELIMPNNNFQLSPINSQLIPHCPVCGKPMAMNLRADDTFVEDEGWHEAAERYEKFVSKNLSPLPLSSFGTTKRILFLELGVGYNTPGIIKYPFWKMTAANPNATYVCVNKGEAVCPSEIKDQSICIDGDIDTVIKNLI